MDKLQSTEPVIIASSPTPTVIAPSTGYGESGLLSTIVTASLLGGGAWGAGRYNQEALVSQGTVDLLQASNDTRRDVKDSESEVREYIHTHNSAVATQFQLLGDKVHSIDKEAQAARYESQIAVKDAVTSLTAKIDCESNALRNQISCFENKLDKDLTQFRFETERNFAEVAERELKAEIRELKREKEAADRAVQSNDIITRILAVLNPTSPLAR
jgi:hypothetical protein